MMIYKYINEIRPKLIKENTRIYESLNARRGILRSISAYGKAHKYIEDEQQELIDMQLDDFKRIAEQYLIEAEMIYVIVGDKATQLAPVTEFAGGNVIELDIHGNLIP